VRLAGFGPALSFRTDAALSPGERAFGVSLPVDIFNSGQSRLAGVSARLRCGSPTPLVNPADRTAQWLDLHELGLLEALSSTRAVFVVDLDPNATARTYTVGIEVAGTYLSNGEAFNLSGTFQLRMLPGPARLTVVGAVVSPDPPQAGKAFTLTVRVRNAGADTARGAWAALGGLSGQMPGGREALPASTPPFSADVALKYLGDLGPGDELSVAFNMLSDAGAPGGRLYIVPVAVGFEAQAGSPGYQTVPVTVKLKAAPAAEAAAGPDWTLVLLTLGFAVVLGILIAVLVWPPSGRARAPPAQAKPLADQAAPAGPPMEMAVAKPVMPAELPLPPPPPPPPPPPGKAEPAPAASSEPPAGPDQLPLPPPPPAGYGRPPPAEPGLAPRMPAQPPVAPPVAEGGGKMPPGARPRPGPLENYQIAGADEEPRYAPPQKPRTYSGREVPMRVCPPAATRSRCASSSARFAGRTCRRWRDALPNPK
jgi:hypothetical protein